LQEEIKTGVELGCSDFIEIQGNRSVLRELVKTDIRKQTTGFSKYTTKELSDDEGKGGAINEAGTG
jgi:hypothetical protein